MKFGPVALADAEGTILAHSLQTPEGRIGKGTLLDAAAISKLDKAGCTQVTVARLEEGDVDENTAALTLANALVPAPEEQNLRLSRPGTGRVNLFASHPGIVSLDASRIDALNGTDPMITAATVPQYFRVNAGSMVATIKIISYSVPEERLRVASDVARAAISVRSARLRTATLIETRVGGVEPSGKGRASVAARLDRLGVRLGPRVLCNHETAAISAALRASDDDLVLILAGSATSDAHDTAPDAVRHAGGQVIRFGMPVDPGNLLFTGVCGDTPVIGLPGCARSPALNGADWVMERVICGLDIATLDIAGLGVGGLLKEIPTRPQPRADID